jgi:hypothetical protein
MAYNFPPVDKIFDDLDEYRDYCRFNGKVYDEAALYRKSDPNWQAFEKYRGWLRAKARNSDRNFNSRRN